MAHIDERMDKFNFNSIELSGFEVTVEREDERFKKTVNINFQGAVDQAGIGIPIESDGDASVNTVSLFGMVDDWFMWVDKNGNQQATRLNEIVECYRTMLSTIKQ